VRRALVGLLALSMVLTSLPTQANAGAVIYHHGIFTAQGDWGDVGESVDNAKESMRDLISACATSGFGVIVCSVITNLLASCAFVWQSCKRGSLEGYCYTKAVIYYADYKKLFDSGWQGAILPYVCPPTGDTYLPDGRRILAPPAPPRPFL
jgi:hypothetical protein